MTRQEAITLAMHIQSEFPGVGLACNIEVSEVDGEVKDTAYWLTCALIHHTLEGYIGYQLLAVRSPEEWETWKPMILAVYGETSQQLVTYEAIMRKLREWVGKHAFPHRMTVYTPQEPSFLLYDYLERRKRAAVGRVGKTGGEGVNDGS